VLIGILNLLAVHLGRFTHAERGWPYSALILLVTAGVVVLRILDRAEIWSGDLEGEQISPRAFEAVQVSIESALAGLLVFFLVFAGYRLMRRGVSVWNVLFTSAVVVALVGWIPWAIWSLRGVLEWLVSVRHAARAASSCRRAGHLTAGLPSAARTRLRG